MPGARRYLLIAPALVTVGWVACAFEDPNAPPPLDPCIADRPRGAVREGLYAVIDNVPDCDDNPARDPLQDTIVRFTGGGWTETSAACRASQQFYEKVKSEQVANQKREDYDTDMDDEIAGDERAAYEAAIAADIVAYPPFEVPIDAAGYCLINRDTPSEVVVYSVCGSAGPGEDACENTLPGAADTRITSEWHDCPGGPLCRDVPEDKCIETGGHADSAAYSVYVDNAPIPGRWPGIHCQDNPDLDDTQDTLWVSTGSGFGRQNALCFASSIYDRTGRFLHDISLLDRIPPGESGGLPALDEHDPTGAVGYCTVYAGTPWEHQLFAMCDQQVDIDGDGTVESVAETACLKGIGTTIRDDGGENPPTWHACPGSPLCCPGASGCPAPDDGAADADN